MERPSIVTRVSPKDPSPARRSGFTLVELLAVIMIIALLAALLTPAVMRSLSSSRAAAVKAEIELLNTALMNYKNEYGSVPPSDMRGLWNENTNSVNTGHPVYKHLKRIFPKISEPTGGVGISPATSPYYWMAQMSPAQALVFWLDGFFDNPQYPLTNYNPVTNQPVLSVSMPRAGTAIANRKKLFDFDESRLYAASAYWSVEPLNPPPAPPWTYQFIATSFVPIGSQQFSTRNDPTATAFARSYPVYFPAQANTGLPYVYFSNSSYSNALFSNVTSTVGPSCHDLYYTATSLAGNGTAIAPYLNTTNCGTPGMYSWAQLHMNGDSLQLIAAGADGTYGEAVAAFPVAVPPFPYPPSSASPFGVGPYASVKDATGHEDNITNFASGRLKEAAEKLSQ